MPASAWKEDAGSLPRASGSRASSGVRIRGWKTPGSPTCSPSGSAQTSTAGFTRSAANRAAAGRHRHSGRLRLPHRRVEADGRVEAAHSAAPERAERGAPPRQGWPLASPPQARAAAVGAAGAGARAGVAGGGGGGGGGGVGAGGGAPELRISNFEFRMKKSAAHLNSSFEIRNSKF